MLALGGRRENIVSDPLVGELRLTAHIISSPRAGGDEYPFPAIYDLLCRAASALEQQAAPSVEQITAEEEPLGVALKAEWDRVTAYWPPEWIRSSYHIKKLIGSLASVAAPPEPKGRAGVTDLNTLRRRAEFVYEAARIAAIAAKAPIVPVPWAVREQDFRDQFLAVIERQCGPQRSHSPEELHGSWMQAYLTMGWVHGKQYDCEKRVHPDLVPYAQLEQCEQDKDAVFIALCEIARFYIYNEVKP